MTSFVVGTGIVERTLVFLTEYLDIRSIWDVILTVLDLCIVAFAAYKIIRLFRDSRANQIGKGILLILCIAAVANVLELTTVLYIVNIIIGILPIIVVVLFQSEFRRLFEGVGHTKLRDYFRSNHDQANEESSKVIEEIIVAAEDLAENRVGALIVFERQTNLGDIISSGTIIDAVVTSALIRQVFVINTPLHDGATVIRNNRIYASGCFLPLTTDSTLNKELGTRHRAGIGVTEMSDCISIIISEETGVISFAKNGILTRDMDGTALRRVLRENLIKIAPEKTVKKVSFKSVASSVKNSVFKRGNKDE